MLWQDRIVVAPKALTGKLVVRNTGILVEPVVDLRAAGRGDAQILESQPHPTGYDIRACLGPGQ